MSDKRTQRERWYYIGAIGLAVLMIASVFLPFFQSRTTTTQTVTPTEIPQPTVPAPVTDFSTLSFEQRYLHPSGLYTVAQPSGFEPTTPSNNGQLVQVNLRNSDQLSVIEAIAEYPEAPLADLEALNTRLDQSFLANSWRSYTTWTETARRVDTEKNQVIIDFNLTQARQNYIARHAAWIGEDGVTYMMRVVTPDNASNYLVHMLEQMIPTLQPVAAFQGSPVDWTTYFSTTEGYVVRYPQTWGITDGSEGTPLTIEGDGTVLRLESRAETAIADESAAQEYVQTLRPNAQIVSVQPVEREGGNGYAVAYSETNLDGEAFSGYVVLLNDAATGRLLTANVRIGEGGVDFNALTDAVEISPSVSTAFDVLETFRPSAPLNLPVPVEEETVS